MRELFKREKARASVPPGVRVYAIGDIHGRADLLDQLLTKICDDHAGRDKKIILVFLGDYVDRGPDSKLVINRLLSLPPGLEAHFLRGNHDQALLDFLQEPNRYRVWKNLGGQETLLSYGVHPPIYDDEKAVLETRNLFARILPPAHSTFLKNLETSYQVGDYLFVHAGVRPGVALDSQSAEDLMWIRDEFLSSTKDLGKIVVHGHTPAETPERLPNRISIDTGAYATGRLTAVALEGDECKFIST